LEKKNKHLKKYETYYQQLRQSVERRETEKAKANGNVNGINTNVIKLKSNTTANVNPQQPNVTFNPTAPNVIRALATNQTVARVTGTHTNPSSNSNNVLSSRNKYPAASTLQTSLQRSAALENNRRA
jgi:hypothetical protein